MGNTTTQSVACVAANVDQLQASVRSFILIIPFPELPMVHLDGCSNLNSYSTNNDYILCGVFTYQDFVFISQYSTVYSRATGMWHKTQRQLFLGTRSQAWIYRHTSARFRSVLMYLISPVTLEQHMHIVLLFAKIVHCLFMLQLWKRQLKLCAKLTTVHTADGFDSLQQDTVTILTPGKCHW